MSGARRPVALVTGATGGLGVHVCRTLAEAGWALVLVVRDPGAAEGLVASLGADARVDLVRADLEDAASVRALGATVAALHGQLDAVVLAAAAYTAGRQTTAEGLERMWAVNVLGYHRTVRALDGLLGRGSRVVVVASEFAGELELGDVLLERARYDPMSQYRRTKQADRMWAHALARRLGPRGVTVVSVGPGMAWTGLYDAVRGLRRVIVRLVQSVVGQRTEDAADVISWAVLEPDLEHDGFYVARDPRPCGFRDPEAEERLWDLLETQG